jgi:hypothetical protein
MNQAVLSRACLLAAVVAFVIAVTGCGSSASTSPEEARAIAITEEAFLKEWVTAAKDGDRRCGSVDARVARQRCLQRVAEPGQLRALKRFKAELERFIEGGLGAECAESVEDAIGSIPSVPSFAGQTTAACRADSRG